MPSHGARASGRRFCYVFRSIIFLHTQCLRHPSMALVNAQNDRETDGYSAADYIMYASHCSSPHLSCSAIPSLTECQTERSHARLTPPTTTITRALETSLRHIPSRRSSHTCCISGEHLCRWTSNKLQYVRQILYYGCQVSFERFTGSWCQVR